MLSFSFLPIKWAIIGVAAIKIPVELAIIGIIRLPPIDEPASCSAPA